jgi:exopolysaccharide biosynthesis polyprenyl glycosylphosphotransferase
MRAGGAEPTLILGTTPLARHLAELILSRAGCSYALLGAVREPDAAVTRPFPCPLLGTLDDLGRLLREHQPRRVIVALSERRRRLPVHHLIEARVIHHVRVENGDEVYERFSGKLATDALTPSRVIFSHDFRPSAAARAAARAVSLATALIGVLLLLPLCLAIAVAIKLDSAGPVLFVQERTGLGGRSFPMFKFRTMHPAGQQRSEWVRDNGDRITRVGRWLRKYRLDELPQFINILRGDMNLVGPRPHPLSNFGLLALVSRNVPECGEQIPYYFLRSMVRPGVTGWAQVRYRYANDIDEEMEKLRYDLYYIKHHSIRLDLRILIETVKVVVTGREALESEAAAPLAAAAAITEEEPVEQPLKAVNAGELRN